MPAEALLVEQDDLEALAALIAVSPGLVLSFDG